jgi:hypothetical protein
MKDEWGGDGSANVGTRNVYRILVENPEGQDHSEDLGIDGRII